MPQEIMYLGRVKSHWPYFGQHRSPGIQKAETDEIHPKRQLTLDTRTGNYTHTEAPGGKSKDENYALGHVSTASSTWSHDSYATPVRTTSPHSASGVGLLEINFSGIDDTDEQS